MADLAIANDGTGWDVSLVDGDLVLLAEDSVLDVSQRIVYALSTWYGESPFDRTAGVPYLDGVFGFEPIPGVAALLRSVVEGVEGVAEVVGELDLILDGRTLRISGTVRIGDADTSLQLVLSPT